MVKVCVEHGSNHVWKWKLIVIWGIVCLILRLSYRTREDVNAVRAERDPIDKVKRFLVESGLGSEEELEVHSFF